MNSGNDSINSAPGAAGSDNKTVSDDKKNKNSVVRSLVAAVCLLMGFASWNSDNKLEKYHNEFVKESFNSVYADKWNKFVEINNREDLTGPMMLTQLSGELQPEIELWLKVASEKNPPDFAKDFHSDYTGRLQVFLKETKNLINAINSENWTLAKDTILTINKIVQSAEKDMLSFKEKLKSDKDFTFKK